MRSCERPDPPFTSTPLSERRRLFISGECVVRVCTEIAASIERPGQTLELDKRRRMQITVPVGYTTG